MGSKFDKGYIMALYRKDNIALIENLKALAIFFCATHLPKGSMFPELNFLVTPFYNAAVPLFVMLSAYFMKSDFENKSTNFVKTVFSMYFWISVLYMILGLLANASGLFDEKCPLFHNGGVFYLELLVIWNIIAPYMKDLRWYILIAIITVMLIGVPLLPEPFNKIAFISDFAFYTPFFLLGLKLDWERIVKFRDSKNKYLCLIYVIPVLLLGYYISVFKNNLSDISLVFPVIKRFLVSIAMVLLAFGFFSGYKNKILHRVGSKCLLIYIFHVILLTWLYGHFIYPTYIKSHCASLVASSITFSVYCLTIYLLSFDFEYRWFFKLTIFIKKFLFKR